MMLKRVLCLLAILCTLSMGELLYARSARAKDICGENKENCLNNNNCQCYCAVKGASRDKKDGDKPLYVKDDPYGHYCYCNQRDIDIENARHQNEDGTEKSTKIINSYR